MSKPKGRTPIYPWDRWFKRKTVRLVRGKHYACQSHAMMISFRFQARRRKCRVSIRQTDTALFVTIIGKPRNYAQPTR